MSRIYVEKPWSESEVKAVTKYFGTHISKGHLASKLECEQCRLAEDPVLQHRTVQNIRDFGGGGGLKIKWSLRALFFFFLRLCFEQYF